VWQYIKLHCTYIFADKACYIDKNNARAVVVESVGIHFVQKLNKYCEILGSDSSIAEESGLLERGTVSLGEQ
jgi:hypothetical protein